MTKLLLCIMGPTASSKTDIAIQLHQHMNTDIISVDSAMIYKGMDIGTAKPTLNEQRIAPHRLIDVCELNEIYSAGQFQRDALSCIKDIEKHEDIPLLTGGTMLYFKSLLQGLSDLPEQNETIRAEIENEAQQKGWHALHKKLEEIDPHSAKRIHPNDAKRIERALEVFYITGKTLHALHQHNEFLLPHHRVVLIAIAPSSRVRLHERIQLRLESMLEKGFLDEAEKIFQHPNFDRSKPAAQTVGYHEAFLYFQGVITRDELKERMLAATRQLAKHQLTWLKRFEGLTWFDSDDAGLFRKVVEFINVNKNAFPLRGKAPKGRMGG